MPMRAAVSLKSSLASIYPPKIKKYSKYPKPSKYDPPHINYIYFGRFNVILSIYPPLPIQSYLHVNLTYLLKYKTFAERFPFYNHINSMLFIYSPLTIRAYLHSPVSRFRAVHGVMVTSTYFIKNKNCLRRTYIPFYCGLTRCSATVRHCRAFRISMVTFTYLFKTKNVYRRQYSLLLRLNATFRNCSALPRPSHLHGNFYISFKNKKPLPLTYILFYYSLTY